MNLPPASCSGALICTAGGCNTISCICRICVMSCSLSAPVLPAPSLRSGAASTPILLSVRHFYPPCRSFRSGALRHFRTGENGRGSQDVLPPGGTGIPGRKIHLQYFSLFCFIMPNRYPIIKRVFIFFQSKHGKNRVKIYMYTKKTGGIRCSPAFICCSCLPGLLVSSPVRPAAASLLPLRDPELPQRPQGRGLC